MLVRVIVYVYPGINRTGVAIVRIENGGVAEVAVGSVENDIVADLLEKVLPTEMVVSTDKFHSEKHTRVPMPSTVTKFTIARPGWENSKIPLVLDGKRQHGAYVHNVYKMMFKDLMRRDVTLNGWRLTKFDREWALSQYPKEMRRDRRVGTTGHPRA